jgi:hypothetical protein
MHNADACMLKCDAEGIMSLGALSMPHAWQRSCAWSLGRGGGGGPPLHRGADGPASDRRAEVARALTRAQPSCSASTIGQSGRGRCTARSSRDWASRRRWQPRAWQPGRRRPGRCTARSLADAWPPNLTRFRPPPRAAPAASACPSPASRAPARPCASPGVALAQSARGWRWRLVG